MMHTRAKPLSHTTCKKKRSEMVVETNWRRMKKNLKYIFLIKKTDVNLRKKKKHVQEHGTIL